MSEHFIITIYIKQMRHLSNLSIELSNNIRQHLLITGSNGSGKTSLLLAIRSFLDLIIKHRYILEKNDHYNIKLSFNKDSDIDTLYHNGNFLLAFYGAARKAEMLQPNGAEKVVLEEAYKLNDTPSKSLVKYMVHLKTQQAYARNEGDKQVVEMIDMWFKRFQNMLIELLDDTSVKLVYDYKNYNFKIYQNGRNQFTFDQLSDGYSAVIQIVTDLMMRMEHNWLNKGEICTYNQEGIVLIDELETHLHIELQKKILPVLVSLFPRIQFIISTHSPYILNSIDNAVIYDLEKKVRLENLSNYSAAGIATAYFGDEGYSQEVKTKLARYKELLILKDPSDAERVERAKLRSELRRLPKEFARSAVEEFADIEKGR